MKKILCSIVMILSLVGCGVTYHSQSGGKEEVAFVTVLRESRNYPKVTLEVDGVDHSIKKLYKTKDYQKATAIRVAPGKHTVKVRSAGQVIKEESIFVGVQETRKIVLP